MTHPAPNDSTPGDDLWAVARDAFLSGATSATVCRDLGLAPSTFWKRAAREGWLRRDHAPPIPEPIDLDAPVDDPALAADKAWRQAVRALDQGRSAEAQRWIRCHDRLRELAAQRRHEDAQATLMADPFAALQQRRRERAALRDALDRYAQGPGPDGDVEKGESVFPDSPMEGSDPPRNRAERRRLERYGPPP